MRSHSALSALAAAALLALAITASGAGSAAASTPYPAIASMACPSSALCIGGDSQGRIIKSVNPTAAAPAWTAQRVAQTDGPLGPIACASASDCVAITNGRSVASTEAGAPATAWTPEAITEHGTLLDQFGSIDSIACPSSSLCVAVTNEGNDTISDDPTAPSAGWTAHTIDYRRHSEGRVEGVELTSISCPSVSLCVAVDAAGRALRTTDPAAAQPKWSGPEAIDDATLASVSCPATSFCIAVDSAGAAVTSTDPAASKPAWAVHGLAADAALDAVACPSTALCVVAGVHTPPESGSFLLDSTDATAPAAAWASADSPVAAAGALLSCASPSLCLLVNGTTALTSQDPGAALPSWSQQAIADTLPAGAATVSSVPSARGAVLTFAFSCASAVEFSEPAHECAGSARITTVESLAPDGRTVIGVGSALRSARHRTVVIGRAAFVAHAGAGALSVSVRLDAAGRRLLARFKRLRATVTIAATTAGEEDLSVMSPLQSVRVTFRRSAPRRRHHR